MKCLIVILLCLGFVTSCFADDMDTLKVGDIITHKGWQHKVIVIQGEKIEIGSYDRFGKWDTAIFSRADLARIGYQLFYVKMPIINKKYINFQDYEQADDWVDKPIPYDWYNDK